MKKDKKQMQQDCECFEKTKPIITDPYGSYTGITDSAWEKPVQDADDL